METNRKVVAEFLTTLMKTIFSMSNEASGNEIMIMIKLIQSLNDAADLYLLYTRAMQV